MNKAIYSILYIEIFEQQCVVSKVMLQSPRLEDHMKTIGIDQSLCNRSSFEHKYLDHIKKIYQYVGKFDKQQNPKDILDADMVSTTEDVIYESPSLPMKSTPVKNQVPGNQCVYSPTCLMLKRKQQNVVLELQNPNADPLKWVIACEPIKQN